MNHLPEFEKVGQAAAYFKVVRISDWRAGVPEAKMGVGAQCVLTGGPSDVRGDRHKNVRSAFRQKRMQVSIKGTRGCRIVTLQSFMGSKLGQFIKPPPAPRKSNQANSFSKLAGELFSESRRVAALQLGAFSRVFPGILICVGRQLILMEHAGAFPVEVTAGAGRVTFEAMVLVARMGLNQRRIDEFEATRWFEEAELLRRLNRLSPAPWLQERRQAALEHIRRHNLRRPATVSIADQAKSVRMKPFYDSLYGLFSKYTHASAWLFSECAQEDDSIYRDVFIPLTYQLAGDVLKFTRLMILEAGRGARNGEPVYPARRRPLPRFE